MILAGAHHAEGAAKKRTDGLSVFIVDMREAKGNGLEIRPIRTMMNHATTEVFFTDMKGAGGESDRRGRQGFPLHPLRHECRAHPDRRRMRRRCQVVHRRRRPDYAKERSVFGRPIGQNQGIQFPIAKAYASMRAAELMVKEATRKYEAGLDCGAEANMAKMLAADASWEAANACVQTHGGFGFAEEYDVERKFRETRLYQVAPISTNLILSYRRRARARHAPLLLSSHHAAA